MPNLQAALRLASHDREFAEALLKNPESFRQGFNLTDKQIAGLKKAAADGVTVGGMMDKDQYSRS